MTESEISRMYRDARLTSIGGGADEIMLGIICKGMGTCPGRRRITTADPERWATGLSEDHASREMSDLPSCETLKLR